MSTAVTTKQGLIDQIKRNAAAQVNEQLAADRAAVAEQQEQVRLRAILYEVARIQVPGQDSLGRSVWHALDFNTEASRQHNMNALMDALEPGEEPGLESFKKSLTDPRMKNRFVWTVPVTAAQRKQQDQAQLEHDRKTFQAACRENGISANEANFGIIRAAVGPNFNASQVDQAAASGAVHVTPVTRAK